MPQNSKYDPSRIEKKWQKKWRDERVYEPDLDVAKRADGSPTSGAAARQGRPFYNLMMFPYPSAEGLHVGNMYAFTGADIYGRMKRMQGYDVFEPIGLDGFGIHSENYALKIGTHPMDQAAASEKRFYAQLEKIGNGFAWDEHLETYDPEYYRWTQWIFAEMFRCGLAYRKKQSVNWCPKDQTVLADEQVEGGKCERCGTEVIKRDLEQWFFKITDYADRLLANLDTLDWSEKVKVAQRNWIGKSEGAEIDFLLDFKKNPADNDRRGPDGERAALRVFTTRPDTLFGATYLVLSPEHRWVTLACDDAHDVLENKEEVCAYVAAAHKKKEFERVEEKEKTGVELKGVKAINPANGEEIPVWVGDYVLACYGTGAIMAVPAHDERDFEFAKKYNLPIKEVIEPTYSQTAEPGKIKEGEPFDHREAIIAIVKHWSEDKYIALKWKQVAWGTFITGGIEAGQTPETAAKAELEEEVGYTNAKFIKEFGVVHGKFYHVPKKLNRNAHAHVVYLELQSDACKPVAEGEKAIHEVLWLSKDELKKFLTPETHHHALRWLLGEQGLYFGYGTLTNSGKFDRLESEEAMQKITHFVGGHMKTTFRLRDWLISRQRYWGPPIPMIYCEACAQGKNADGTITAPRGERADMPGWYAVADAALPVVLPHIENFRPTGSGVSPLAAEKSFYEVKCPNPACGGAAANASGGAGGSSGDANRGAGSTMARRETDVSDTFLDSAWHYLRYLNTANEKSALDPARIKKWLPAEMYTGGAEHAVLHLLYVRFIAMVLHDWRGVGGAANGEPLVDFEEPFKKFRAHGLIIKDGAKMSKSKGNVINPDEYIANFGADTLRMYLMFLAPFEQGGDFRDSGLLGVERFLKRVWKMAEGTWHQGTGDMENKKEKKEGGNSKIPNSPIRSLLHKTIKKVTEDIERLHYNTAVSALMILLNAFEEASATADESAGTIAVAAAATAANPSAGLSRQDFEIFLKLLAPFAPHMTEEIWRSEAFGFGRASSIHRGPWPSYDEKLIQDEQIMIVFQVNGKVRDTIMMDAAVTEAEAKAAALASEKVQRAMAAVGAPGAAPKKIIYIEKRLVNIVVEE